MSAPRGAARFSLTTAEVARRAGVHEDVLDRLWSAAGLADANEQVPLGPADVAATRAFAAMADALGENTALAVTAALGLALARTAEAVVTESVRSVSTEPGPDLVRSLGELAAYCLRTHVASAAQRLAAASATAVASAASGAPEAPGPGRTVGFVDLVGSTAWSQRLGPDRWADAMDEFSLLAADVAAERGVQVVKFVGDGVMLVAAEPRRACAAALDLVEACGFAASLPPARAGLAHGPVAVRAGDYHGAVVALAARVADRAGAGTVLAAEDVATLLGPGPITHGPVVPASLRGFDRPVGLVPLTRTAARGRAA